MDSSYRSEINRDVTPAAAGEFPALALGPISVSPPVVLAPMAGITDAPFRSLCRGFGAVMVVHVSCFDDSLVRSGGKVPESQFIGLAEDNKHGE